MATSTLTNPTSSFLTATTLLPWGTYGNGTHNLSASIERYSLLLIAVGFSGRYNTLVPCGQTGDVTRIYTEDGWLTITLTTATSITISGAGSNSAVREIRMFKNFKTTL